MKYERDYASKKIIFHRIKYKDIKNIMFDLIEIKKMLEETKGSIKYQYVQGISQGVVKKEELRQFIFSDETLEESKKAIEEIEEETPSVDKLLDDEEDDTNNNKDKQKDKEDNKDDKKE